jgi:hypothetical protein
MPLCLSSISLGSLLPIRWAGAYVITVNHLFAQTDPCLSLSSRRFPVSHSMKHSPGDKYIMLGNNLCKHVSIAHSESICAAWTRLVMGSRISQESHLLFGKQVTDHRITQPATRKVILEYHQWLFNVQRSTFDAPAYHNPMPRFGMNGFLHRFEFGSAKFFAPFYPPLSSLVNSSLYIYVCRSWVHD